jgi:hypothetical protein
LKGDKTWLKEGFLEPAKKIKKENCVRGIFLRSPRQRRGVDSPYNKSPIVKIPEMRRVYDKFLACF